MDKLSLLVFNYIIKHRSILRKTAKHLVEIGGRIGGVCYNAHKDKDRFRCNWIILEQPTNFDLFSKELKRQTSFIYVCASCRATMAVPTKALL